MNDEIGIVEYATYIFISQKKTYENVRSQHVIIQYGLYTNSKLQNMWHMKAKDTIAYCWIKNEILCGNYEIAKYYISSRQIKRKTKKPYFTLHEDVN